MSIALKDIPLSSLDLSSSGMLRDNDSVTPTYDSGLSALDRSYLAAAGIDPRLVSAMDVDAIRELVQLHPDRLRMGTSNVAAAGRTSGLVRGMLEENVTGFTSDDKCRSEKKEQDELDELARRRAAELTATYELLLQQKRDEEKQECILHRAWNNISGVFSYAVTTTVGLAKSGIREVESGAEYVENAVTAPERELMAWVKGASEKAQRAKVEQTPQKQEPVIG